MRRNDVRIAVTSMNFVDAEIDAQLTQLNLTANETADDASFLRRLQLDLTGRLPTPEELLSFQSNVSGEYRTQSIDTMLESPSRILEQAKRPFLVFLVFAI